ncbi:MAG: hypothetical protein ACM3NT_11775, partial [Methylocystaceae bacterium]
MINNERLVNLFMEMVQIDSVSFQEAAYKEYLRSHLQARGLLVKEDNSADVTGSNSNNLIAFLPGRRQNSPIILLGVHMDTVEPGKGIKPQLKDGRITASGDTILAADDKAGVAVILEMLDLLLTN